MRCEDFPCCGHEDGDCNGGLYGSDEAIKEQVSRQWATGHGYCDHADGIYNCDEEDEDTMSALGRDWDSAELIDNP